MWVDAVHSSAWGRLEAPTPRSSPSQGTEVERPTVPTLASHWSGQDLNRTQGWEEADPTTDAEMPSPVKEELGVGRLGVPDPEGHKGASWRGPGLWNPLPPHGLGSREHACWTRNLFFSSTDEIVVLIYLFSTMEEENCRICLKFPRYQWISVHFILFSLRPKSYKINLCCSSREKLSNL